LACDKEMTDRLLKAFESRLLSLRNESAGDAP